MRKGLKKLVIATLTFAILTVIPALASWNQDSTGWTYQKEDGSTPKNAWEWIDGKCYYFDEVGHILQNTTTPDNCQVNADGAWIVDGVVQTQGENTSTVDVQYPLKDILYDRFTQKDGVTSWKWDFWAIPWDYNDEVKEIGAYEYLFGCAVKDKNPDYLIYFRDLNLSVLAELSGYPQTGLNCVEQNKKAKLIENVGSFLNSFNWREASDFDKAAHIAKWIAKADYSTEKEDVEYAYGCLINGYASCQGYTEAAELLATCVGLKTGQMSNISHAYPVFLVNDIWLAYEPTTKDSYFTVAEVYDPAYYLDDIANLNQFGRFCKAVGYTVPNDITGVFPNVGWGSMRGKPAPFIYFE